MKIGLLYEARDGDASYHKQCDEAIDKTWKKIQEEARAKKETRVRFVTVDCTEVNADELVNDPQFMQYAQKSTKELPPIVYDGYGKGNFGTEQYGR
jgi:hypothetical protein